MLFHAKAVRAITVTVMAGFAALGPAVAAQAVTNPADNPSPITVKGDDGNTYIDGQDTLPGFDDEECTYIPGAFFDFANNRVHYADGQSIAWTEWSRATGYSEWLAEQNSKPEPKPSATSTQSSTSGSSTKSGGSSKSTSGSSATDAQTSTSDKSSATEPSNADDTGTTVDSELTDQIDQTALTEVASGLGAGSTASDNPGRVAGLAILGGLLASAVLLLLGSAIRQNFWRGNH